MKQALTDEVSKGGIVLTGDKQVLPFGEVMQLGPESPQGVEVGDIVLFTDIAAIPIGIKKHYKLLEPDDVLAILSKEDVENVGS